MRRIIGAGLFAAAAGAAFAVVPAAPAGAAEVVEACVTVQGKQVGVTINGTPIVVPVPAVPRTCVGV